MCGRRGCSRSRSAPCRAGRGTRPATPSSSPTGSGSRTDRVRLITGDTDRSKFAAGSHSGRSIRLASITIHAASQRIIEKGLRIAAHLLETAEADIAFAEGRFTVAGTDRSVELFAVAAAAERDARLPEELRGPFRGMGDVVSRISSFPHGWHVAEVEIDPETGKVELARYTAIDDVGRAVNPMIIHGQTHGGIAQGMGQALMEHCVSIPTAASRSPARSWTTRCRAPATCRSSRPTLARCRRPPTRSASAAAARAASPRRWGSIINAVVDALAEFGVTHIEMPATPEKVWRAMRYYARS